MKSQPMAPSLFGQNRGFFDIPAAFDPIRCRHPDTEWPVIGPYSARSFKTLKRKAHPPLQTAAIAILTLVGNGREELMEQIAVRHMQFARDQSQFPLIWPRSKRFPL